MEITIPMAELIEDKKVSIWDKPVPMVQEGKVIHAYISDDIIEPAAYNELCHLLMMKVSKTDEVVLHLNTPGGIIDSANKICDAIERTPAKVKGVLTGTVASAGTMIVMAVDEIEVAHGTSFMIHNYSGGVSGKGHEMRAQQEFVDHELNIYFNRMYKGFLTSKEIQSIIDGKDVWMGRDEILKRWDNKKRLVNE